MRCNVFAVFYRKNGKRIKGMKNNILTGTFMLFVILGITGCGSKATSDSFIREDVDLGYIERVAVLPLENHSDDKYAAKRVRNVINTQILAMGLFDTVEQGLVDSVLLREAIEQNAPIDQLTLKRLGQRLKVQAFVMGAVDQAGDVRRGANTFPEIAMTIRLLEAESGRILWQASGYRNGESLSRRLFGMAAIDSYQVALHLTRDLLFSLLP
jgi:hypothetical protein